MKKKIIIAISALLLIALSIIGTLRFVDWKAEQEAIRQAEIAAELKARQEAEEKARQEAEEKAREEARIASIKAELEHKKNRLNSDLNKYNRNKEFILSPNFKANIWDCEDYYQADFFTALANYRILEYTDPDDSSYHLVYYLYNTDRQKVSIFENGIALLKKTGTRFVATRADELKLIDVNGERTPLMQAYYGETFRVSITLNEPIENFDPKDYGLTINSLELKPRRNTKFHPSEDAEIFRKSLIESFEKEIIHTQQELEKIEKDLSQYL